MLSASCKVLIWYLLRRKEVHRHQHGVGPAPQQRDSDDDRRPHRELDIALIHYSYTLMANVHIILHTRWFVIFCITILPRRIGCQALSESPPPQRGAPAPPTARLCAPARTSPPEAVSAISAASARRPAPTAAPIPATSASGPPSPPSRHTRKGTDRRSRPSR